MLLGSQFSNFVLQLFALQARKVQAWVSHRVFVLLPFVAQKRPKQLILICIIFIGPSFYALLDLILYSAVNNFISRILVRVSHCIIDQFRYTELQPKVIDLGTRLWGITKNIPFYVDIRHQSFWGADSALST